MAIFLIDAVCVWAHIIFIYMIEQSYFIKQKFASFFSELKKKLNMRNLLVTICHKILWF